MKQPLAYIHPGAKLAPSVVIDPFVTIDNNVEIGEGTRIGSNVTIMEGARIGKNCTIFPGAVIGAIPQDLKFRGEGTTAIIGDNTTIREFVTINRGTASKGKTVVGNNCLIMAYSHIAHDCVVGNNVIIANASQLAGEVVVDDYAIIGGGTLVHQFCHLGSHSMIQGGAATSAPRQSATSRTSTASSISAASTSPTPSPASRPSCPPRPSATRSSCLCATPNAASSKAISKNEHIGTGGPSRADVMSGVRKVRATQSTIPVNLPAVGNGRAA